jgi:hypothetical protein
VACLFNHVREHVERTVDNRSAGVDTRLKHDLMNLRHGHVGNQGLFDEPGYFACLAQLMLAALVTAKASGG